MPILDFSALTFFDIFVIIVICLSALFSMLRGMTREFLGLAGWIVAVFAAVVSADFMREKLSVFLKVDGLTEILSWALPFVGTVVIWFILASVISPGLKQAGLGALDKWLGIVFGLLRGVLFSMIIYGGCVLYTGSESELHKEIKDGQTAPYISYLIVSLQGSSLLPQTVSEALAAINLDAENSAPGARSEQQLNEIKDRTEDSLNLLSDEK